MIIYQIINNLNKKKYYILFIPFITTLLFILFFNFRETTYIKSLYFSVKPNYPVFEKIEKELYIFNQITIPSHNMHDEDNMFDQDFFINNLKMDIIDILNFDPKTYLSKFLDSGRHFSNIKEIYKNNNLSAEEYMAKETILLDGKKFANFANHYSLKDIKKQNFKKIKLSIHGKNKEQLGIILLDYSNLAHRSIVKAIHEEFNNTLMNFQSYLNAKNELYIKSFEFLLNDKIYSLKKLITSKNINLKKAKIINKKIHDERQFHHIIIPESYEYLKGYKVLEVELESLKNRLVKLENIRYDNIDHSFEKLKSSQLLLKKIQYIKDKVPKLKENVNVHISDLYTNFKYDKDQVVEIKNDKTLFLSIFTFLTSIIILILIFSLKTVYSFYKKENLEID